MPAEIDTEERILYFSLEMFVLYRARNLKKLGLFVLPRFLFFVVFIHPLFRVNFVGTLLFRGHRFMESQRCEVCTIERIREGI